MKNCPGKLTPSAADSDAIGSSTTSGWSHTGETMTHHVKTCKTVSSSDSFSSSVQSTVVHTVFEHVVLPFAFHVGSCAPLRDTRPGRSFRDSRILYPGEDMQDACLRSSLHGTEGRSCMRALFVSRARLVRIDGWRPIRSEARVARPRPRPLFMIRVPGRWGGY